MPVYNTQFELDTDDIDLIESALRHRKSELSRKRLSMLSRKSDSAKIAEIDSALSETHDLLGRLHNQKVFFRPAEPSSPYVGG